MDDAKARQNEGLSAGGAAHRQHLRRWHAQEGSWKQVAAMVPIEVDHKTLQMEAAGNDRIGKKKIEALLAFAGGLLSDAQAGADAVRYALQTIERLEEGTLNDEHLTNVKTVLHKKSEQLARIINYYENGVP